MDNKKQKNNKVAIAMSGGVDSSVAAALLKKQGYNCVGIFMKFWTEKKTDIDNKCCSLDAYTDARKVAGKLGIPLYTLNFQQSFKKAVVDDWLKKHQQGLTPNPCIRCNQFIKFDLLLKKAKLLGCDYLATGHYVKKTRKPASAAASADRQENKKTSYELIAGKDSAKDQSYFLYTLKQDQLKHLLFPLGNLTKTEVRAMAKDANLPVYQKAESQEICFIAEKTHYPFLKRHLALRPGPIKNLAGETLGQHQGLPLYTLGQRQGIGIGGIGPFYVVKLDYKKNTLIVSSNSDDRVLYAKKFKIKKLGWISGQPPKKNEKLGVKIRYQAKTIPCTIDKNIVTLKIPQRAVMPGQSAVFYQGQTVLGGGIIGRIKNKPLTMKHKT